MADLPQGWGFPGDARKAHYFLKGEIQSICGKWWFSGERFDEQHDHRQNCVQCIRERPTESGDDDE